MALNRSWVVARCWLPVIVMRSNTIQLLHVSEPARTSSCVAAKQKGPEQRARRTEHTETREDAEPAHIYRTKGAKRQAHWQGER